MPELPEVETIRRQLAEKIVNKKLDGKKTHLWNCDAALWLVIGAINEYARSSRDIRSIPPSL